ncbi:hypothetical protein [Parasutterella muris]|uniref:hypothetical protein n=1 Tax=Parasutterella muris TaxID=2565572 RepID=UPI00203CFC0A|nr:hypothetical protein [Parasutterella muris]
MPVSKIAEATSQNATLIAKAEIGSSIVKFRANDKTDHEIEIELSVRDFKEFIAQLMAMKPFVKENVVES